MDPLNPAYPKNTTISPTAAAEGDKCVLVTGLGGYGPKLSSKGRFWGQKWVDFGGSKMGQKWAKSRNSGAGAPEIPGGGQNSPRRISGIFRKNVAPEGGEHVFLGKFGGVKKRGKKCTFFPTPAQKFLSAEKVAPHPRKLGFFRCRNSAGVWGSKLSPPGDGRHLTDFVAN